MFVSSLGVKVGSDGAVIERHTDVQERYRCERIIGCKFNSGVNVIFRAFFARQPLDNDMQCCRLR